MEKHRRPAPPTSASSPAAPGERYRQAFQRAADSMLMYDVQGHLVDVNRQACASLGYERAELLSLSLGDIEEDFDPTADAGRWCSMKPGEPVVREATYRRKDGSAFPVEARVSLIEQNSHPILLVVARNVAAHRRTEEELRQAQKMEALGRLAGGISHDFNNLLTAIVGYSDLALGRIPADAELRADLEEIKRAGERAAALTRQLLSFSRHQAIRPKAINLSAAVRGLESMLRRLIPESIRIELDLGMDPGNVRADPGQVDQVILNLALNGRDAMPRGGTLRVSTATVDLDEDFARRHAGSVPGDYVVLSVADTGTGIPKEVIPHLFEPFFTTKAAGKGTGLGLATVFGIVKQNGGFLSFATETGKGTTFRVYFPRHGAESERSSDSQVISSIGGTETILLVEDDPGVRRFSAQSLSQCGYHVLEACNPAEALAVARQKGMSIDLLLTDMVMPELNGRELAKRLRGLFPDLPIVYMTGYTEDVALREGRLEPGSGFIAKPFTAVELLTRIRKTFLKRLSRR